jgi:hypothetical protein
MTVISLLLGAPWKKASYTDLASELGKDVNMERSDIRALWNEVAKQGLNP